MSETSQAEAVGDAGAEYQFSSDWVTEHADNWLKWSAGMSQQPVKVLEIGSWEGRSAIWWLDHVCLHPTARLFLCDPCPNPDRYRVLMQNLLQNPSFHKLNLCRCVSMNLLPNMPDNFYDLIYVDGSHEASDVMMDACLAYHAAKRGGLIIFDDYAAGIDVEPGILMPPKVALDGFLAAHDGLIEIIDRGYQLAVRKI